MNYEIVSLEEKSVIGYAVRTGNREEDMGMKIGGMWGQLFQTLYGSSMMRKESRTYGIYREYETDETGKYTFMAACEPDAEGWACDKKEISRSLLPAGIYARFRLEGDLTQAVPGFWQMLWNMDLPRSFVCDFEEYETPDMEHGVCLVYIGLKR